MTSHYILLNLTECFFAFFFFTSILQLPVGDLRPLVWKPLRLNHKGLCLKDNKMLSCTGCHVCTTLTLGFKHPLKGEPHGDSLSVGECVCVCGVGGGTMLPSSHAASRVSATMSLHLWGGASAQSFVLSSSLSSWSKCITVLNRALRQEMILCSIQTLCCLSPLLYSALVQCRPATSKRSQPFLYIVLKKTCF